MATSDISRLRSMSVFSPRRRRSVSEPLSEDLETISPLEPVAKAPQLDIPNISMAGIEKDEPQNKFRNLYDRINSEYTPETQDIEAYRRLRDAFPQREEPSFMRKLVASTQAWDKKGGIDEIDKVLNQPYNEDLLDWKEKTQPHFQLASLEGQRNTQERTLLSNTMQAEYQAERNRIQEDKNKAQADAAKMRNEINMFKAQKWTVSAKGDRVIAVSPDNPPRQLDLGPSSSLSEAEKIALEGQWDVAAQEARGAAEQGNIQARGQNVYSYPDGSMWRLNNDNTWEELKPAGSGQGSRPGTVDQNTPTPPRVLTPAQMEGQKQERYNNYYAANPQHRKYFTAPDRNGNVKIRSKASMTNISWGPFETEKDRAAQKEYDDFFAALEGQKPAAPTPAQNQNQPPAPAPGAGRNGQPPTPPAAGRGAPPAAGRGAAPSPQGRTGKIRVRTPDGKTGTWDLSKAPLPRGYTVIQ